MAQEEVAGLSLNGLKRIAYNVTYENLISQRDDELLETITEFYPDLKDSVEMEDGK